MKPYLNVLAPLLVVLLLDACKVSKDVQLPKTAVPENFRNAKGADSASIATRAIHDFFTEPELQRLVDTALVKNYDLQLALKNIEFAQQLFKQAKSGNVPQLNLQVTASSSRPSDNSVNGLSTSEFLKTSHIEDFNANLGLSWEADIWGKIKGRKQAALATYLQTEEARKAIQTRLVANVAQGYYILLLMDAQFDIAK
jgi:outer membrane protein TolC